MRYMFFELLQHNAFLFAKSKLFPQYRGKSLQGFFAFKLKVSSTGGKSLQGFFRSNSKSSLQGFWEIPIGICSFKLKVILIGNQRFWEPPTGIFLFKFKVSSTGGRSLQGFCGSNSKSPVQRETSIGIVLSKTKSPSTDENLCKNLSLKLKVSSTGSLGNPYREFFVQTQSHPYRDFGQNPYRDFL